MLNASDIVNKAKELGFDKCGIVPVEKMLGYEAKLDARTARFPQNREKDDKLRHFAHLQDEYPWAKAVVIGSLWYGQYRIPEGLNGIIGKCYQVDARRNSESAEYQASVAFENYLRDAGLQVATNRDFGLTAVRWAAVQAGIGIVRKNNFFYTERGSYLMLEAFIIDAPLEYTEQPNIRPCPEGCTLCQRACPTQALAAPYLMDRMSCLSELTTWSGWDLTTEPLRDQFGTWVYGCDACQDACPFNRSAWTNEKEFPGLADWAEGLTYEKIVLADYDWLRQTLRTALWYIPEDKVWHYKTSTLNAMRNNYKPAYLPVIRAACHDPEAPVRDMAKWVLEQLDQPLDE